jgi:energy-coupling factor transporter ATP-binding protein EcfA2
MGEDLTVAVRQLICVWGSSGTGKTSLLDTFVRGLHAERGKRTRLYSAESAQKGPIEGSIAKKIVEAWFIDNAAHPFERIVDATSGGWPEDGDDPKSVVIPAFLYRHVAKCGHCATLVYSGEKAPTVAISVCPKCKQPVSVRVVREVNEKNGIGNVGAVLYEGMTAFGEMLMDNMTARSAKGDRIGEDVAVRFQDGSANIASASRSSYGIAQRRMKQAVQESRHLPVDYVIWTATKERGEDTDRRVSIFGPKLPGSAATPDIPRWFGPCLGSVLVPPQGTKPAERRLYLTTYFETWNSFTSGVENTCNSRIPPSQLKGVPEFYKFDPDDDTLLWKVVKMIEERQGLAVAGETSTAPVVAVVGK